MLIIFCGPLEQCEEYSCTIHTYMLTLGNFGRVILLTLFIGLDVHPNIIHKKRCPSQLLFIENNISNIHVAIHTDSSHNIPNIHNDTIHYSCQCQCLLIFYVISREGKRVEAHVMS